MSRPSTYKSYIKSEDLIQNIPGRTQRKVKLKRKLDLITPDTKDTEFTTAAHPTRSGKAIKLTDVQKCLENQDGSNDTHLYSENSEFDAHAQIKSSDNAESTYLYNGSKITKEESSLLLLAFASKLKLTKDNTNALLELVNLFLPSNVKLPSSFYTLKKQVKYDYSLSSLNFYCKSCAQYFGTELQNNCERCAVKLERCQLVREGSFFITFDLKKLLESTLTCPAISKNLYSQLDFRKTTQSDLICDLTDGIGYKKLGLGTNDISCTFNTDGVPVFKSSKFSIWPILFSINELPYKLRASNTLIGGLWFGTSKPNFDIFFSPFVKSCNQLAKSGITWSYNSSSIQSRVLFPTLVTDSVARCICQGLTQFNGAYGCTWCLAKGQYLKVGETGHKWIYPKSDIGSTQRTKTQFLQHLKSYQVMLSQNDCGGANGHFGIKSASQLLFLEKFDIVKGFLFDYMHTAFLGISRCFTNHWLDSKNCRERFYCGTALSAIDKALMSFAVPFEFDRAIRSINHIKFWKASEWRSWTYISIFVMKNILPDCYLRHFSQFVLGIMILAKESISLAEVELARKLFNQFAEGVENLYGLEYCSYNVHILTHAADCVLNWGPLWAYSAFQFENHNGILLNLFNGTQHVELQIATRVTEMLSLETMGRTIISSGDPKNLFLNLIRNRKLHKNVTKVADVTFVGNGKQYTFNDSEIAKLLSANIDCKSARSYNTCFINSHKYNSLDRNSSKRCNSVVMCNGNSFFMIRKIILVTCDKGDEAICLASKVKVRQCSLIKYNFIVTGLSTSYSLLKLSDIHSKFICSMNDNNTLSAIVKLPNCMESD